jgi:hypothetical protein
MEYFRKTAKKRVEQRKKQSLLKTLSSFTVTTVVAAVAFLLPVDATATLSAQAVGNAIYYDVNVTDPETAIVDGTLYIVAKGKIDEQSQDLAMGQSTGVFLNLSPDSDYEISVHANQGFGDKTLVTQIVHSDAGIGGLITDTLLLTERDPSQHFTPLSYQVDFFINDPNVEIVSLRLRYAVLLPYEMQESPLPPADSYTELVVDKTTLSVVVPEIPDMNATVFLIFEADLLSGGTVVLDQKVFRTPVKLECSLYQSAAGATFIEATFYGDFSIIPSVVYTINLYSGVELIQTETISKSIEPVHEEMRTFRWENLNPSNVYRAELIAEYQDPETGSIARSTLIQMDLRTSASYSAIVQFTEHTEDYDVSIQLNDPNGIVQNIQYTIYTISPEGYRLYLDSGVILMQSSIPGVYQGSTVLNKPVSGSYEITIAGDISLTETEMIYGSILGKMEGSR